MNPAYTYIADLMSQAPDIPDDSIISRAIYDDENLKVILFKFAAGQELSEHTASLAATLHFVDGEANLTLGDDSMTAQPGTWVHMPPQLHRSINAKTPVTMLPQLLEMR